MGLGHGGVVVSLLIACLVSSGCVSVCSEPGSCGGSVVEEEHSGDEEPRVTSVTKINGVECQGPVRSTTVLEWTLGSGTETMTSDPFLMPVNTTQARLWWGEAEVSAGSWNAVLQEAGGGSELMSVGHTGSTGPAAVSMNAQNGDHVNGPEAGEYEVEWSGTLVSQELRIFVTAEHCS